MDDAALVEAARGGDPSAWGAIYDRYADRLHDHCHRILRDRDEAADALHDSFMAASRNLHQLRDPSRLRPWLYSICRHVSLRRLKSRQRVETTDAFDDMSASDDDLDRGLRSEELSELVWAAAAGLNGRDQALLDLNLRQGLEGQDLADAMGTTLANSYVMLSRVRDQVERSLGALLIARLGRQDCEELDEVLGAWDGRFSPLLRKRVARHVDGCEICGDRRRSVVSPLALLAAAPLVPATGAVRARLISSLRDVGSGGAGGPGIGRSMVVPFNAVGFAAFDDAIERRQRGVLVALIAAVLLVVGGFAMAFTSDDEQPVETAASTTSHPVSRAVTESSQGSTSTSPAPGSTAGATASTSIPGTSSTTKPKLVPPSTGSGLVSTHPLPSSSTTPTVSDGQGPAVDRMTFTPSACGTTPRFIRATAQITDASPMGQVTLTLSDGNLSFSTTMTKGQGSTYTATAGDFPDGGSITWTIRATDESANLTHRSGTLSLSGCTANEPEPAPTTSTPSTPPPGDRPG